MRGLVLGEIPFGLFSFPVYIEQENVFGVFVWGGSDLSLDELCIIRPSASLSDSTSFRA